MAKILGLRGMIYSKYNSEAEFARALGWSRQRLSKITNGGKEPSLKEVRILAEGLGQEFVDVANIFLRKASPCGDRRE